MEKHYKSKIAAIAVGTAIKVLTGVVCGAVVLTGTYGVVKHTVLPNSTAKTQSMFSYEGEAGTGGTGGSIGDNPIYQTGHKIPEGATYYVGVTGSSVGNYSGATATYNSGDNFPDTVNTGDVYVYGDYEYRYNMQCGSGGDTWMNNPSQNGWDVCVFDTSKTSYGSILESINGKPITNLYSTFVCCTSLTTAPEIPSGVKLMYGTFGFCSSLVEAPVIPQGVENMEQTFFECSNLTTAPVIPNSVKNLNNTFYDCISLTTAPNIPNSVKYMNDTFNMCTSLTTATEIPNSVTRMSGTFSYCESLTGTIIINANPTEMYEYCFDGTVKPITLTGSSTILNELAGTATNGNVTVG